MSQTPPSSIIPPFRLDGYLPEGIYVCSEAEVIFRFGSLNRRRRLVLRLRRWIELGRQVGARRLLVDGSFVRQKQSRMILIASSFCQWISCCSLSENLPLRLS